MIEVIDGETGSLSLSDGVVDFVFLKGSRWEGVGHFNTEGSCVEEINGCDAKAGALKNGLCVLRDHAVEIGCEVTILIAVHLDLGPGWGVGDGEVARGPDVGVVVHDAGLAASYLCDEKIHDLGAEGFREGACGEDVRGEAVAVLELRVGPTVEEET